MPRLDARQMAVALTSLRPVSSATFVIAVRPMSMSVIASTRPSGPRSCGNTGCATWVRTAGRGGDRSQDVRWAKHLGPCTSLLIARSAISTGACICFDSKSSCDTYCAASGIILGSHLQPRSAPTRGAALLQNLPSPPSLFARGNHPEPLAHVRRPHDGLD